MKRADLLKSLLAAPAAVAAAKLDPDGEPLPDTAPLIVVNAPGTTLAGFTIDATGSRRTAVQLNSDHTFLVGGQLKA